LDREFRTSATRKLAIALSHMPISFPTPNCLDASSSFELILHITQFLVCSFVRATLLDIYKSKTPLMEMTNFAKVGSESMLTRTGRLTVNTNNH